MKSLKTVCLIGLMVLSLFILLNRKIPKKDDLPLHQTNSQREEEPLAKHKRKFLEAQRNYEEAGAELELAEKEFEIITAKFRKNDPQYQKAWEKCEQKRSKFYQAGDNKPGILNFISNFQNEDSSFGKSSRSQLTSLALLSYLTTGHNHRSKKFGLNVSKAIKYLLNLPIENNNTLDQVMILYCLSETYIMTDIPEIGRNISKRLQVILENKKELISQTKKNST